MGLSNELISQFVKTTKDDDKTSTEATVYGTTVEYNGEIWVQLDGSERFTPVATTTDMNPGERVTVMIKNHTATVTGNLSSPSARTDDLKGFKSTVESEMGDIYSTIDQTAGNILLEVNKKVGSDEIISKLNISEEGILIQSKHIDFTGAVTFSALGEDVTQTLDEYLENIQKAQETADDAQEKADTANINANAAQDTANTANSNASSALATANSALSTANDVDYLTASWCSANNRTLIDGSKIYSGSITAEKIKGGTLSGITLDVDTSASIGQTLELNQQSSGAYPSIEFRNTSGALVGKLSADSANSTLYMYGYDNLYLSATNGVQTDKLYTDYLNGYTPLTTGNYTSYCVSSSTLSNYMPKSGGTFTGTVYMGSNVLRTGSGDTQTIYNSGSQIIFGSTAFASRLVGSTITTNKSITVDSDQHLKENIVDVNDDDFANFVLGIDLVEYNYVDDPEKEKYVGAIAQQVQAIDSEISKYYMDEDAETGRLGIKESALVYPIISTLKRQQKTIEAQEARINRLEELVNQLISGGESA